MRKLLVAVLALAALGAVVSVALAANTYKVHKASTTASGKGSKSKPIPTGLTIGFQVGESDPARRATVIEKYSIGAEGLVTNPKVAPKCAFTDLDNEPTVPSKCNKAQVGSGIVLNAAGASNDQALAHSSPCNLQVRLYNSGSGMIIRLDSQGKQPPGPTGDFSSRAIGCLLPIATSINAKFVKTTIGDVAATDLRFSVPQNLKHPLAGIDNSIRESVTVIALKTKVLDGRKKGYYEKVGCKDTKRTTHATFTTEATATQPPQKFTATKKTKC
jgi:hypothetical protein